MRREELLEGISELVVAIKESQVADTLEHLFGLETKNESTKVDLSASLSAMKLYVIRANSFGDAARKLVQIFKLSPLEDPKFWGALARDARTREIWSVVQDCRFVLNYLPRIAEMIKQSDLYSVRTATTQSHSTYADKQLLTVYVIEEDEQFSSPQRLSDVLESISLMYEVCAAVTGERSEGLSVVACDSGSDKSFDFLGTAKLMECVKEIILSLWDRVVFYRERQVSERIDLISKSLPIIEKIGVLEKEGKLGREEAEILRRKVSNGASKFIEAGATIPELRNQANFDPRELMSPTQKLLTASSTVDSQQDGHEEVYEEETTASSFDIDDLSPSDREQLMQLLGKAKKKTEPKKASPKKNRRKGVSDTKE